MKTNVYFVRHAEPDFSVKDDLIRPLTMKGHEDAGNIVRVLMDKDIKKVYSSPYKRAIDTISPLAKTLQLEIIEINDFRERRVGGWVEDFLSFATNQWENFDYKLDEGESLREVQQRNIKALNDLINDHLGQNILVGTHGTALSTIINYFNPMFGYEQFMELIDKMPYILCFEFENFTLKQIEIIEF